MDGQANSKYFNWLTFFVLGVVMLISILVSEFTPEVFIESSNDLLLNNEAWNVHVKEMNPYNQVLYMDLELCSKSESWFKLLVQGTDQPSGLIGNLLINSENIEKFSCDKIRLFQLRIEYKKYLIDFNIVSSEKSKVIIGFENSDYVNFNIITKGIISSLCLMSSYLYSKLNIIKGNTKGTYAIILSIGTLLYVFPYKMLSVTWNYEFWNYIEMTGRLFYIQSLFTFCKSRTQLEKIENFVFLTMAGVFLVINSFSTAWFYFSLCLFGLLCWFFFKIYIKSVTSILLLDVTDRFELILEIFIVIFVLLGIQCGTFRLVPEYPKLETLNVMLISFFLVYLHWGHKLIKRPILTNSRKAFNEEESEMIDIPFSNYT